MRRDEYLHSKKWAPVLYSLMMCVHFFFFFFTISGLDARGDYSDNQDDALRLMDGSEIASITGMSLRQTQQVTENNNTRQLREN